MFRVFVEVEGEIKVGGGMDSLRRSMDSRVFEEREVVERVS